MVDKVLILKSLENSIIKCRKGGGIPNVVKKTFNEFADSIRDLWHERLIIVNTKGEIEETVEGDEFSVPQTREEVAEIINNYGGDLYADHNHPTPFQQSEGIQEILPTKLSGNDMYSLLSTYAVIDGKAVAEMPDGMSEDDVTWITAWKSITAECSNGSRMTLNRIGVGDDNVVLNNRNNKEFREKFENELKQLANSQREFHNSMFYSFRGKPDTVQYDGVLKEHLDNYYEKFIEENNKDWKPGAGMDIVEPSQEELYSEAEKFCKSYVREEWGKNFKDNVKGFKELGFELTFEWTN